MGENDQIFIGLVCVVMFAAYFINLSQKTTPTVNVPLDMHKLTSEKETGVMSNTDLFWGTYRPNLYFGIKPRTPDGPVFGLFWFRQYPQRESPKTSRIRHTVRNGVGEVTKFGWVRHDGSNFGKQEITDNFMELTTSFAKRKGGEHGGDWSARISGKPLKDDATPKIASFMFYIMLGKGELKTEVNNGRIDYVTGATDDIGNFRVTFPPSSSQGKFKYSYLRKGNVTNPNLIQGVIIGNSFYSNWNKDNLYWELPANTEKNVSLVVFQVTAELPFKFEVLFESGSFTERPNALKDEHLTGSLVRLNEDFDNHFSKVFNLKKKEFSDKRINFAKTALSNLLGEISYFHGASIVKTKESNELLNYWPAPLYTTIPSRTSFPRGFFWNSGFDNILLGYWNPKITKDILSHWLDLMNTDGWIPREQILGIEALSMVESKYVVQINDVANPPSLFLAIESLINNNALDKPFLKKLFPRLKKWFYWLHTTQAGEEPTTYYWKGRDDKTTLEIIPRTPASGLDDYPRASHPNTQERHLDLRCWMAYSAGVLSMIANELGESSGEIDDIHTALTDNEELNRLHWSPEKEYYTDFGLHTDYIILTNTSRMTSGPELTFVNSYGYVSLFPVMLKIIDRHSTRLCNVLEAIKNPDLLWTDFGLRSLAANSNFYQRYNTLNDPPYWRGAIWINLNYLTLRGLYYYATNDGKCQKLASSIYEELRSNIINNMFKVYHKQGFIYEYYDDTTGEGRGAHPFFGWSALVVAIMAEKY